MANWATLALRAIGFRAVGRLPDVPRCIVVFAPHTSNWDFLILLLARSAFGHPVKYLAKDTLFRAPYGWLFRALGGIPVNRREKHDLVATIAHEFTSRDTLWLALAPEGTRKKTDHWKSGFYYIALEAKVPILTAFIDTARRECGYGELLYPSGDAERDLDELREFYRGKRGVHPERASEIRFRPRKQ